MKLSSKQGELLDYLEQMDYRDWAAEFAQEWGICPICRTDDLSAPFSDGRRLCRCCDGPEYEEGDESGDTDL